MIKRVCWVVLAIGMLTGCSGDSTNPNQTTTGFDTRNIDTANIQSDTSLNTTDSETTVYDSQQPSDTLSLDTNESDSTISDTLNEVSDSNTNEPYDVYALPEGSDPLKQYDPDTRIGCLPVENFNFEDNNTVGWNVEVGTMTIEYGRLDGFFAYPDAKEGQYYASGGDSDTLIAWQTILLNHFIADIDTGTTYVDYGALVRTGVTLSDSLVKLRLKALDENDQVLAEVDGRAADDDIWTQRRVGLKLPIGTRSLQIGFQADHNGGSKNAGYFDSFEACLHSDRPLGLANEFASPPYLMSIKSNSVSLMFENYDVTTAKVQWGQLAEDGNSWQWSNTLETTATLHEVTLDGLQPGQQHHYQITIGDTRYPIDDFKTAPTDDSRERVQFVMFADNQDGPVNFAKLSEIMTHYDPDFLLHGGDCVQNGKQWEYQQRFLQPLFGLANRAGLLIGAGNHETYSSAVITSDESRALWEHYVSQPGDEHCFGWRWGPLFVLVIDTERGHAVGTPQYECIQSALSSDMAQTAQFRTALFHRPPLVEYWSSVAGLSPEDSFYVGEMDAPDVRDALTPLFEIYDVDLVFNGHNHLYAYSKNYPYTVDWVTSGGGGGGLETESENNRIADWSPYVQETIFGQFHFLQVVIEESVMYVRAVNSYQQVIHEFSIQATGP